MHLSYGDANLCTTPAKYFVAYESKRTVSSISFTIAIISKISELENTSDKTGYSHLEPSQCYKT